MFRQGDAAIPFDISQVKAFPYTVEPLENLSQSKELVIVPHWATKPDDLIHG